MCGSARGGNVFVVILGVMQGVTCSCGWVGVGRGGKKWG